MRVVIDTNVFVSALHFGGVLAAIFDLLRQGAFQLYLSPPIVAEIREVLAERFAWTEDELAAFLSPILAEATFVWPSSVVSVCDDEDDNRILECALEAHADVIVTGDKDLLRLGQFQNIPVVAPRAFLNLFRG